MPILFVIYDILIEIYFGLVSIAALFNSKAKLFIDGRKDQFEDLSQWIKTIKEDNIYWIHAASYGEFEMAKPIIKNIRNNLAEAGFIISFFSPSGFENITFTEPYIYKIYLPKDKFLIQKKLIEIIKPKAVLFIKYEFWFNLLRALKSKTIPYYFVSLNLYESHYLLKKPFTTLKNLLKDAEQIFCLLPSSNKILKSHGFTNSTVIGDSRIAQVLENKDNPFKLLKFKREGISCICYGSVTKFELDTILKFIKKNQQFNHIIALHDNDPNDFEKIRKKLGGNCQLYSNVQSLLSEITILDTYGDLKYIYRFADIAYVGGGFEKGPHNVLEPLIYNIPVCCGPNTKKFAVTQALSNQGLVTIIRNLSQFESSIKSLLDLDFHNFEVKCREILEQYNFAVHKIIATLKHHE